MASEGFGARHGTPPSGGAPWSEFEQLYRAHHAKLTTYLTRRGISPADASDIVSVSFADLWKFWQKKERPQDPTPYLYKIVRTRMVDHIRRQQRAARVVDFDAPDAVGPSEEFAAFVEPEMGHLEAVATLLQHQHAVPTPHGIGLKDTEIAALVGHAGDRSRPPGTAPTGLPEPLAVEAPVNRGDTQEAAPPSKAGAELPPDFEAFYLGHQEMFCAYAEIHFGSRTTAEEVVHVALVEVLAGWTELLRSENLVRGAWAIVRRTVHDRLKLENRAPAFAIKGPIAQALAAARDQLKMIESASGLYGAIAELPGRQFDVIVLRYMLGYPASKVAWYMGIDERTVGYHLRRGRERLRVMLGRST
ncbi:sigma-70 family RNA polymerase sigma factor [Streptomyces sp. 5-8]|uniref:Sigma-70 family RNA polymerase sigma factor n=1 Tax=Streptomyces musisoli TaxID=2802280 RepID=A0ABS1PC47_9ACTN|nr:MULTISPECIES: sigma-70 family RNA polymerase sigma factor [Streptomyces]MBL1109770.1 sigma-70 family RNA polymerase sigma factor [Streptomyces musisoli]MBY8846741.1 sigma-70 family RNA polymerase sigma factor [Streptomyces sp. SP2-10]